MSKQKNRTKYEEKYLKTNRTFPTGKTVLLAVILVLQIGMILAAVFFEPTPQDRIRSYDVTVQPRQDGSLDIHYHFVWEAVDTYEALTWIEIGMANENYTVFPDSVSDTISRYTRESHDGEVYLVLDLDRAYTGGEVLEFSFKINQRSMLCQDSQGYFYEFVPGWFNSTPVDHYTFRWADNGQIRSASGARRQGGYCTWSGSLECGGYVQMGVRYGQDSFASCDTVPYKAFDDSGTGNALKEEKIGLIIVACFTAAFLVIVQVWIVDSVVSYHRGRGFLTGHGYHIHTYGRSNPYYIKARDQYNAKHTGKTGSRGGHGGCACACACACAGGGRAGCSQKDTYPPPATAGGKPKKTHSP